MNKTKIDWADMTWNPVTGCLHDCEYCYAKRIVRRFSPKRWFAGHSGFSEFGQINVIETLKYENGEPCIYPYGFDPTFHRYRLDEPLKIKKPQNIFVCSMADLFGNWVPFEWIKQVFEACEVAPQHRYLFLTKNPERYCEIIYEYEEGEIKYIGQSEDERPELYSGASVTNNDQFYKAYTSAADWLSIEPLHEELTEEWYQSEANDSGGYREWGRWRWIVIGAETGNQKGKVIPKRKWIEKIVNDCRGYEIPIFMKNSLKDIWQEPLIQEYPWNN